MVFLSSVAPVGLKTAAIISLYGGKWERGMNAKIIWVLVYQLWLATHVSTNGVSD